LFIFLDTEIISAAKRGDFKGDKNAAPLESKFFK